MRKPKLIFLDEDALVIPEFDTSYFIEVLFKEMKSAGIFSICKNFRNLHYYTRVYVMKDGTIVENDNPLTLVSNKKSLFYDMLLKDDIRTVRQLENKIEKNKLKFERFLNNNLFHIKGRRLLDILSRSGINYSDITSNVNDPKLSKNSFSDENEEESSD